jgi:hypothetical protein
LIAYVDSSALVKLVVAETETADLVEALGGYDAVVTSELAVVEVTRAATRAADETDGEHAEVLSTLGQLRIDRAIVERADRRHWHRRRCDHSTPYTSPPCGELGGSGRRRSRRATLGCCHISGTARQLPRAMTAPSGEAADRPSPEDAIQGQLDDAVRRHHDDRVQRMVAWRDQTSRMSTSCSRPTKSPMLRV